MFKSIQMPFASTRRRSAPAPPQPRRLPPWKVLLHNDEENTHVYVARTICELTPLQRADALRRTDEAHFQGVALLLTTHQELAELYQQQFTSKGLVVSIEPEER